MKTNPRSTTRSLVLAALFLALAFVLPMITGHVSQVGNMLCPMHFPILLCGFVLGGPWGLAVGFIAPLVRSVLFGMPPMFPIAISMAFGLAAYGLVSGVLWHKVKHTVNHHTQQLFLISLAEHFGIAAHRVERDKHISGDSAARGVVESDNIGVVIVLQKLAVHFQDFLIVAEDIGKRAHRLIESAGDSLNPAAHSLIAELRQINAYCVVSDIRHRSLH